MPEDRDRFVPVGRKAAGQASARSSSYMPCSGAAPGPAES
jgi:hypothetical protein